eukprot:gene7473-5268_t
MPLKPDFIPISKGKQMFALSSWRDAPATPNPNASCALGHTSAHPTPRQSPSLAVLRAKEQPPQLHLPPAAATSGSGGSHNQNNHPNNGAHPTSPTLKATAAAAPAGGGAPAVKRGSGRSGKKDRRGGGGAAQREGAAAVNIADSAVVAASTPVTAASGGGGGGGGATAFGDVVDYYVHLFIPAKVHSPSPPPAGGGAVDSTSLPSCVTLRVPQEDVSSGNGGVEKAPNSAPSKLLHASLPNGTLHPHTEVLPSITAAGMSTIRFTHAPLLAPEELIMQLKAQAAPLRIIPIGFPKVMVSRKIVNSTTSNPATTTSANNNNTNNTVAGGEGSQTPSKAQVTSGGTTTADAGAFALFQTPALKPFSGAAAVVAGMELLPPTVSAGETDGDTTNSAAVAAAAALLPPGIPEDYQISTLFAEEADAVKLVEFMKSRYPMIATKLVPRARAQLNASLVLKGLPSLHKSESILHELHTQPHHPPSYVRLHRSERGVFKNVIFIKYPNRTAAEDAKLWLERLYLGPRPVKVEFKKKSKPIVDASVGSGAGGDGSGAATATPRQKAGHNAPVSAAATPAMTGVAELEQLVRALRVSTEHEGFHLSKADLTKEELRILKQLCQFYSMRIDLQSSPTLVTVKRHLAAPATFNNPGAAAVGTTTASGTTSAKPSPALRPQPSPSTTFAHANYLHPPTAAGSTASSGAFTATSPAPAAGAAQLKYSTSPAPGGAPPTISPRQRPLEFKLHPGMSAWRDSAPTTPNPNAHLFAATAGGSSARGVRAIIRCQGEEGGAPAFPPGRGRPV